MKKDAQGDGRERAAAEEREELLSHEPACESILAHPKAKEEDLSFDEVHLEDGTLTTDQGIPIPHTDDSLRAGERGPTLMEDFHFREKLTHFDHERIPERVVHARGSGAHGFFQVYESLEDLTCADFLCDPTARTPVFVRFSTVVGSRGSTDLARDVRGFATKFYTREGNFDLVGNNMPVFFIQDGIKFPDLIHAVKPEPHHEMPQAQSAHDTFWDFVSLVPETLHMVMWLMSDRAIPRSYRMMEGFGVHTFRLVDREGRATSCKFFWKPLLGAHSVVWDEAQKISGKDPDFHRRDLYEAIEDGDYPEYELGIQVLPDEGDETAFGIDLLDATKLVPEELAPVRRVGKLTLDRNPKNFFAETEQVAFHIGNLVPGIDVTNDPLLQARLFSYLDTQLLRLGGPNFHELPINRSLVEVYNHQQDGFSRRRIHDARALYHPNSIQGNAPRLSEPPSAYVHLPLPVAGAKTRRRSPSFDDHVSQARLFLDSQSPPERRHLIDACRFEIGKVERLGIRERVIAQFARIDVDLAREVAAGVGVTTEVEKIRLTGPEAKGPPRSGKPVVSPALSLRNQPHPGIRTRKVALLATDGVRRDDCDRACKALRARGAKVVVVAPVLGPVKCSDGTALDAQLSFLTGSSVLFDALVVPGWEASSPGLAGDAVALHFVREAFKHAKPIGALNEGVHVLAEARLPKIELAASTSADVVASAGVVTAWGEPGADFDEELAQALRQHRHFDRDLERVPA